MADNLKIIHGKLYVAINPIWVTDINLEKDIRLQPTLRPIFILKHHTLNDFMYLTFLIENKLYKTELYDNPSFYFKELSC